MRGSKAGSRIRVWLRAGLHQSSAFVLKFTSTRAPRASLTTISYATKSSCGQGTPRDHYIRLLPLSCARCPVICFHHCPLSPCQCTFS